MTGLNEAFRIKYGTMKQRADADEMQARAQANLLYEQANWHGPNAQSEIGLRNSQAVLNNQFKEAMQPRPKPVSFSSVGGDGASAGIQRNGNTFTSAPTAQSAPQVTTSTSTPAPAPGPLSVPVPAAGTLLLQDSLYKPNALSDIGLRKGSSYVRDKTGKGSPKKDTVPAMLAHGEAVLNAGAAQILGRDQIEQLNRQGLRSMGSGAQPGIEMKDGRAHAVKGGVLVDPTTIEGYAQSIAAENARPLVTEEDARAFEKKVARERLGVSPSKYGQGYGHISPDEARSFESEVERAKNNSPRSATQDGVKTRGRPNFTIRSQPISNPPATVPFSGPYSSLPGTSLVPTGQGETWSSERSGARNTAHAGTAESRTKAAYDAMSDSQRRASNARGVVIDTAKAGKNAAKSTLKVLTKAPVVGTAAGAGLAAMDWDDHGDFYKDPNVSISAKFKQGVRDIGQIAIPAATTTLGTAVGSLGLGIGAFPGGVLGAAAGAGINGLIDDDGEDLAKWRASHPKPEAKTEPKAAKQESAAGTSQPETVIGKVDMSKINDPKMYDEVALSNFFGSRGITKKMRDAAPIAAPGRGESVSDAKMRALAPSGYVGKSEDLGRGSDGIRAWHGNNYGGGVDTSEAGTRARIGLDQRDFTPGQVELVNDTIRANAAQNKGLQRVDVGPGSQVYRRGNEYFGMGLPSRIAAEEAAAKAAQPAQQLEEMRQAAMMGNKLAADMYTSAMAQAGYDKQRDMELQKAELINGLRTSADAQKRAEKTADDMAKVGKGMYYGVDKNDKTFEDERAGSEHNALFRKMVEAHGIPADKALYDTGTRNRLDQLAKLYQLMNRYTSEDRGVLVDDVTAPTQFVKDMSVFGGPAGNYSFVDAINDKGGLRRGENGSIIPIEWLLEKGASASDIEAIIKGLRDSGRVVESN